MPKKPIKKPVKQTKPGKYCADRIVITMVVDESGSMDSLLSATIEGFNAYIDTLKRDIERGYFSAFKFNAITGVTTLQSGATISEAMHLSTSNYFPVGGTPLLDAVGEAIRKTDALMVSQDANRAVVVIQTDGAENASRSFNLSQIKQMIEERQTKGWQFVFIGAGINAFADATRMGIAAMNTMSYAPTGFATRAVFEAMGQNTRMFANCASADMGFSTSQSAASGESASILKQKMASKNRPQSRSA